MVQKTSVDRPLWPLHFLFAYKNNTQQVTACLRLFRGPVHHSVSVFEIYAPLGKQTSEWQIFTQKKLSSQFKREMEKGHTDKIRNSKQHTYITCLDIRNDKSNCANTESHRSRCTGTTSMRAHIIHKCAIHLEVLEDHPTHNVVR